MSFQPTPIIPSIPYNLSKVDVYDYLLKDLNEVRQTDSKAWEFENKTEDDNKAVINQNSVINVDFSGWSESKQQLQEIRSVNNYILLEEMLSEIDSLLKNEYDWDEIDYGKPTLEDISRAKSVLIDFVFTINEGYLLKKPYISNFEEGGASIKWKIGDRTLYLEIAQNDSVVSKVWRESGKTLAKERPLLKKDYLRLWKWIINEE